MSRFVLSLAFSIAVFGLSGCPNPQAPEAEPHYTDSTLEQPPIATVRAPLRGQTVAVVPFINKTLSEHEMLGDIAPDVLSAYALEAGFRVVEGTQAQLDSVEKELALATSSRVDTKTAAQAGKLLGARYVLLGAVTSFRKTYTRSKDGFDFLGLFELRGSETVVTYDVQISSRIIEVQTREVLAADAATAFKQHYEVSGGSWRVLLVGGKKSSSITNERESYGKVLQLAFAKSLNKLIAQVNGR